MYIDKTALDVEMFLFFFTSNQICKYCRLIALLFLQIIDLIESIQHF